MAIGPIRRQGLHRQVVRQIGINILRRALPPGLVLPNEADLCRQLGVSRSVLREAVKVLAAKGLVESRPGIGTRVRQREQWNLLDPDLLAWQCEIGPEEWFLRNVSEVRRIVEPVAAALAAVRATPEERASIESWYREMVAVTADTEAFIAADMQLHATILAASHNELLVQIVESVRTALRFSRTVTTSIPGANQATLAEHWRVVAAIRAGDDRAAEAAMRDLVVSAARDIEQVLQQTTVGKAVAGRPEEEGYGSGSGNPPH